MFSKFKSILIYGGSLAFLLLFLKWLQWRFLIPDQSMDLYSGIIALLFTALGVWLARNAFRPKATVVVVEKEVIVQQVLPIEVDQQALAALDLSAREYEVLQLLTKGHSNAEIADGLFVSINTIKTHASNLFVKMNVKSRTQAIEMSRRLRLTN